MLAKALAQIRGGPAANKRKIGPIGMHCALQEVHFVQMSTDDSHKSRLEAAVSEPFQFDSETMAENALTLPSVVRKALRSGSFRGRTVVSTMPSNHLNIFPLSFKVKPGQNEAAAIVSAVQPRIERPLADYVMDFLPVRSDPQVEDRLGIVALAEREKVLGYLDVLRKCGLRPSRLEIGPVAIRRLVSSIHPSPDFENVIAINFGQEASYLSVISGRRLLLDQALPFGENRLLDVVGAALGLGRDQVFDSIERHGLYPTGAHAESAATIREIIKSALLEVVEEINRTLIYIASQTRGEPVRRVFLLGSLARWNGADRMLNGLIKLDVETIPNPLSFFSDTGGERQGGAEIAVATGLALSGILDDD